jgi:hypothetical protein
METSFTGKTSLTYRRKNTFKEAMLANKPLKEIIEMLELDETFAREVYVEIMFQFPEEIERAREQNKIVTIFSSNPPHYYKETKEMDIGELPVYKFEELSKTEIIFYKMNKLTKFKIDVLLHMNAVVMTNLGTDSTKEEIAYVQRLKRENNKKIKEISPEFYKTINDGEK